MIIFKTLGGSASYNIHEIVQQERNINCTMHMLSYSHINKIHSVFFCLYFAVCLGTDDTDWIHANNIRLYNGCTKVVGNLQVLLPTFNG